MKVAAILVLASASACALAHSANTGASFHHLEARDPTFGLLNGVLGGILGGGSKPSLSWQCNGSGNDGWNVDYLGQGRPSWCPSGWLWFGSNIGWAPPSGWSCGSTFQLPSLWLPKVNQCTWWSPPDAWKQANAGINLGISIPSWWKLRPDSGWQCNKSGNDGWNVDYNGNGRPSWCPEGWLWYGSTIGWAPPSGWSCAPSFQLPSQWLPKASSCTWWSPPDAWKQANGGKDYGISLPSFWKLGPSSTWQCNGSGNDGWNVDYNGSGRPSWCPSGWLWFGSNIGWAPPSGWSCASDFQLPSQWLPKASSCTWWSPSDSWKQVNGGKNFGISLPSFWKLRPDSGWKCNGSGNDGWNVDNNGNGPSGCPSDWKYFGQGYGWGPSAGWNVDISFDFPSFFLEKAKLFTWYKPSSAWVDKHHNDDFPTPPPDSWGCTPDPTPTPDPEPTPTEDDSSSDGATTTVYVTETVYSCHEKRLARRSKQRLARQH
ncbi:hypothetical protein JCM10212_000728 [Sporobolomyces blumeae]